MNHTKNYNLPQWELNDLIRMEDFNGMCVSLETGMTNAAADAAEAKETAETARRTSIAAYSPTNKPYVTGTYTGTGKNQVIDVGFRPSFVIVTAEGEAPWTATTGNTLYGYNLFSGGNVLPNKIKFTDTGVILKKEASQDNLYPNLTDNGRVYDYIFFR